MVLRIYSLAYRLHKQPRLLKFVSSLSQALEVDALAPLPSPSLTPAQEEVGCLMRSPATSAQELLHPYAFELYSEPFLSMATVISAGEDRVFCNEGWSTCFFREEEAGYRVQCEGLRPVELVGSIIHPDDQAYIIPLVDNCLLGSPDTLSEASHILKCRSPRTKNVFLALLRVRVVVSEDYLCLLMAVQPLPLPVEIVKVCMPTSFVAGRNPWEQYLDNASKATMASGASALPPASHAYHDEGWVEPARCLPPPPMLRQEQSWPLECGGMPPAMPGEQGQMGGMDQHMQPQMPMEGAAVGSHAPPMFPTYQDAQRFDGMGGGLQGVGHLYR